MPLIFIFLLVALALSVSFGLTVHLVQKSQSQKSQSHKPEAALQTVYITGERTLLMDDFQQAMLALTTKKAPDIDAIPKKEPLS